MNTNATPNSFSRAATVHLPGYGPANLRDIIRLESADNYTFVFWHKPRPYLCATTLLHFERELSGFVRVGQHHLINPLHLVSLKRGEDAVTLIMRDNCQITLPRKAGLVIVARILATTLESLS